MTAGCSGRPSPSCAAKRAPSAGLSTRIYCLASNRLINRQRHRDRGRARTLEHLVGRSHECDHPESVRSLPVCTRPRIAVDASIREIDRPVKESARTAVSIYEVFEETIERLEPTHILTQIQVCPVSLRDVEQAMARGMKGNPKIVSLQPDSLAEIWEDVRRVARALGDRSARRGGGPAAPRTYGGALPAGASHRPHAARGMHRVAGAAVGGRELDAGTHRHGGRYQPLRRGWKTLAVGVGRWIAEFRATLQRRSRSEER